MSPTGPTNRIAVCSWSLQAADPHELVAKLRATGLHRVQLALDPLRQTPRVWGDCADVIQRAGLVIVSGMFRCVNEDYSTLDSIRVTGGIAPDATWEQNLENARTAAGLAAGLQLSLVTFHAGFLPHDESDPNFAKMRIRLGELAEVFAAEGIDLGLETGQETAPTLAALLEKLARPNLGVNFDPANMILYGKGNPIEALRVLKPWIRQVHIKDAIRAHTPGTWGEEVPVGAGEVDWRAFFATLREMNYAGDFVIEREARTQREVDIRSAIAVVANLAP